MHDNVELYVIEILQRNTDKDHPMTLEEICERLDEDYNMPIGRRALSDVIKSMEDIDGFYGCIRIGRIRNKGIYMESGLFTNHELQILIDSVSSAKYLTASQTKNIISKLSQMRYKEVSSNYVKNMDNDSKTDNEHVLDYIDIISGAIASEKKIKFKYSTRDISGKVHETTEHTASPYHLLVHNQYYYVMVCDDKYPGEVSYYRIDKMVDCKQTRIPNVPLRSIGQYKLGLVFDDFSAQHPYLYSDEPRSITFRMKENVISQLYDWFGKNNTVYPDPDKKGWARATIKVSPNAFRHWATQYIGNVEVLAPQDVRNMVIEAIRAGYELYNK